MATYYSLIGVSGQATTSEQYRYYNNHINPTYHEYAKYIEIKTGVIGIGGSTFSSGKLIDVKIPDSVTYFGSNAFSGCRYLTSVTISDYVTFIDTQCFRGCTSLTSITIPNSVTTMRSSCFYQCSNLISITLSNSMNNLPYGTFGQCTSLSSITIPNSVTSISSNCFEYCSSLTSITIPNSVTTLGDGCFNYCTSLASITIPTSVTSIGSNCFSNCTSLRSVFMTNNDIMYVYTGSSSDPTISTQNFLNDDFTDWTPIPKLDSFNIEPSLITLKNQGIINMTFSSSAFDATDISNSLIVDPSNAGIINSITDIGSNNWTANFVPQFGLILTDCSLNFKNEDYLIDQTINFNIDATFEILDFSLTPPNLVNTDVSGILRIEFNTPISDSPPNFNFTLDPSYIATLGPMSDVSGGFVWEGTLTRTEDMNKLGIKLEFDFSYNGVEVSANLVFDVVQNADVKTKQFWASSKSDTVNNVFTKTLQMSPNGSLMGFVNGANVEIYRKTESSNWVSDVSYIGHKFALTNNHIAIASDASLQIYDYSGNSWNIMNGGNRAYSNIIALSINVDGNVVAVSDNSNVKLFKNINNNWTHINTHIEASVNGLSLSPNGLKLGMGIGNTGEDFSSIIVEDVVVVVDNTPPVITLDGSATMTIELYTPWVEPGYTASDNNDGDISNNVVITGNVDVSNVGEYILQYDVSDNAGNEAVTVTRTVNVVEIPVWSYPDTDIFELVDLYTNLEDMGATTTQTITLSGNSNTFLNGNYTVTDTGSHLNNTTYSSRQIFRSDNAYGYSFFQPNTHNDPVYGTLTLPFINQRPYDSTTKLYVGATSSNSIATYYSQLATNGQTYDGNFLIFKFPFRVQPSSFECHFIGSDKVVAFALLGSNDNGTTYDLVGENTDFSTGVSLRSFTTSTTSKYDTFKFVITAVNFPSVWESWEVKQIKLFGDIYTLT